jgi:hypothetical protein
MHGEIDFIRDRRSSTVLPRSLSRISRSCIAQDCNVMASLAFSRTLRFAQATAVLVVTEFCKVKTYFETV